MTKLVSSSKGLGQKLIVESLAEVSDFHLPISNTLTFQNLQ